jgi:hypothetical protein
MLGLMWDQLQREIQELQDTDRQLYARTERSETTSGVPSYAFASTPKLVNGAKNGDMVFITNARKTGEGAGLGTGLVAYYNSATDSYYRFADDTAVVI